MCSREQGAYDKSVRVSNGRATAKARTREKDGDVDKKSRRDSARMQTSYAVADARLARIRRRVALATARGGRGRMRRCDEVRKGARSSAPYEYE